MHAGAFQSAAAAGALFRPPRGLPADMPTVVEEVTLCEDPAEESVSDGPAVQLQPADDQ
jgi:hypothetical protein